MLTAILHRPLARNDDPAFLKAHRRAVRALESLDSPEDLDILDSPRLTLLETLDHALQAAHPSSDWFILLQGGCFPLSCDLDTRLRAQPADVAAVEGLAWIPGRGDHPARRDLGVLPELLSLRTTALRRSALVHALHLLRTTQADISVDRVPSRGSSPAPSERSKIPPMGLALAAALLLTGHRIASDPALTFRRPRRRRSLTRADSSAAASATTTTPPTPPDPFQRFAHVPLLASLPMPLRERLFGVAAAREALARAYERRPFSTIAAIEPGPGAHAVRLALQELAITHAVRVVGDFSPGGSGPDASCDVHVIASLAVGGMLDTYERLTRRRARCGPRILCPFDFALPPACPVSTGTGTPASAPSAA
jgi:hypothetical protein